MAKSASARPEPPRAERPAEQTIVRVGWLLAVIAIIGLIVRPSMLNFGLAKAPKTFETRGGAAGFDVGRLKGSKTRDG